MAVNETAPPNPENGARQARYQRLFRKFIGLTLVCSLLPLLLVGWGMNLHYARFSKARMLETFENQVQHHRQIIELFLQERREKLQLIANTLSKTYLANPGNLNRVFEMINNDSWSISDIGVIDDAGRHLAYIGPYDLLDKNYAQTLWFQAVMTKGVYISDMFLGFRKEPHFIIAVTGAENGHKWILRATIDTEVFRSLVENVRIGKTGEVYLLNRGGVLQTSSRFSGNIMEKASFPVGPFHEGIKVLTLNATNGDYGEKPLPRRVVAEAWFQDPQWLLVVSQDYDEAFEAVNHTRFMTLVFLHLSALSILVVTFFVTKYMIKVIQKRDLEADQLNRQLMQAGKLASIGELSAGVAHEINNPLAIIQTERQILMDLAAQAKQLEPGFAEQFNSSMEQIAVQIERCKRITHNLLRFSRRTRSVIETVELNSFLEELIDLVEREARTSGIKFQKDFDENLPASLSDPSQLQQVFLNLITNAIHAHDDKPYGCIRLATRDTPDRNGIEVVVADTGCGIAPENLDKVFDPFFTTKAVGKGTGLGLSICYSIVRQLGGEISVQSEPGKGTAFHVFLPYDPPQELTDSFAVQAAA